MKKPFNLSIVLKRIEKAVKPYPKAAMFELYERGYTSLFEQLISCIISIRTLDETTIPLSEKLLQMVRTPKELIKLSPKKLEHLLHGATFPGQKAYTMLGIAKAAIDQYNGELPANFQKLTELKGVGPKCANLALGVSKKQAAISVDVHVHRVTNRWGLLKPPLPNKPCCNCNKKCRNKNGLILTACSCHLENMFAPAGCPIVLLVLCWNIAGRLVLLLINKLYINA